MTIDPMNLTGAWFGSYSTLGSEAPDVSFIATIEDAGGLLAGETSERTAVGGLEVDVRAMLRGSRDGTEVAFTKAFDTAGEVAHAAEYRGTLDEDGRRVSGAWEMEGAMGGFEMHREIVDIAEEAVLEEASPLEFEGLMGR